MTNNVETTPAERSINHVVDTIGNGGDRLITDVEKVTAEIVRRIDAVSPKVLEHLESVSAKAWEVLVERERLAGCFSLFSAILLLILLGYLTKFFIRKWNNSIHRAEDLSIFSYIIVAPIITLVIILLAHSGFEHLLFPEYFAAQELIDSIVKIGDKIR